MRVRTRYDYEPLDVDSINTRRRIYNISDNVSEDANALCAASKRQDQRLLSNITDKLGEMHTSSPVTVKHRHHLYQSSKPPLPPSAVHYRHVARSQPSGVVVGAPSIKTVVLRHGARASSVPPKSAALQEEVEDYMEGTHRPRPVPQRHYDFSQETVRHRPSYRAASEPPASNHHMANMAVKQAKHYLDRIENELGVSDRTYMADDSPLYMSAPRAVPRTGGYHSRYYHDYVPASPSVSKSSRIADIEAHLDLYSDEVPGPPPTSYSNLRHRAAEARNKLDQAKSMYDRYLPVYLGPETDVEYNVENKYSQLASRDSQGQGGCRSLRLTVPGRQRILAGAPHRTDPRPGPQDHILLLCGPLLSPQCQTPVRGYVRYSAKPRRTQATTSRYY